MCEFREILHLVKARKRERGGGGQVFPVVQPSPRTERKHVKLLAEKRTNDEPPHHLLSPGAIAPLAPQAVALSRGAVVSTATSVTRVLAARANGTRIAERHERRAVYAQPCTTVPGAASTDD